MLKQKLILLAIKVLMGAIALGVGIWYMSSSIGGASISYTSMDGFLTALGVRGGDIATANGCFMCGYIERLFGVIGTAAEQFWTAMVNNIWIIMAVGFGIFLIIETAKYLYEASKKNATLDTAEKKIEFKPWFDKVWKQGVRVMIAGALLGVIGFGGTAALRAVTNVTITPVMFVGAELSMAATGINTAATCGTATVNDDILNPVLKPFMCVMGNLNAVMLAGAAGGFALMNYAWMDLGGGAFTWVAGLALIIMFLIIGFDLFFQVLSVIFKLIFLIIFLPVIIAAGAFEGTWAIAKNVLSNSVGMLVKSAVRIVAITLKILVIYATVSYAADEYFPGPNDGYNAILPPLINQKSEIKNQTSLSVMNVFSTCEKTSLTNGVVDKDIFKTCFTAQRAMVERQYPGAFDFMKNGWEFMLMMLGLFFLYYYAVNPKIDKLLGKDENDKDFDFGTWTRELGTNLWAAPAKIYEQITKKK